MSEGGVGRRHGWRCHADKLPCRRAVLRRVSRAESEADSCPRKPGRSSEQEDTIAGRDPGQTPSHGPAAGITNGGGARTGGERGATTFAAAERGGEGTRSDPGGMDAGATGLERDAHAATAAHRRTQQHVGTIGGFVRAMEGRLQHMPGQRTSRRAEGMADMRMRVGGRS